jgi:leucyl aminopeptidase
VKFSQTQKGKVQPVPTLVIADCLNEKQFEEFAKGLLIGTYNYPFEKTHAFWNAKFELHFENLSQKKLDTISKKAEALSNGQTACQEWLNKPANLKKPDTFSLYLKNLAKKYDLKYTSFNRKKCEELGLGAYLSVNQEVLMMQRLPLLNTKPMLKMQSLSAWSENVYCLTQEEFL